MTLLLVLLIGVTLGATLGHGQALKEMKRSIETDFAAIHERLKEKL